MERTMGTRKHIRVKSKFRFTIFVVISLMILVTGFNTIFGLNTVRGGSEPSYVNVEVLPGETLWDIAASHMSSDMDKREAVYLIKKANGLDDSSVSPGQIIKVPVS